MNKSESEYELLLQILEGYWERPFSRLPIGLRQRVESGFFPMTWAMTNANGRKSLAAQVDAEKDPRFQVERNFWSDFHEKLNTLRNQIDELVQMDASSPLELESKTKQLKALREELGLFELTQAQRLKRSSPNKSYREVPEQEYVSFTEAKRLLAAKFDATANEIAAWLVFEEDALVAYKPSIGLIPPPRFLFHYQTTGHDYLAALMGACFGLAELEAFEPTERYVEGSQLIKRWDAATEAKAEAFILARIGESRLTDLHPITGKTKASDSGHDLYPPLEEALFPLSQVEEIENVDLKDSEFLSQQFAIGSPERRTEIARGAALARHSKPGGSHEKQEQMKILWVSGKYSSRDICAEEECAALDMSYSAARKALRNTPDPIRNT